VYQQKRAGPRYGRFMTSSDYYVVFSVGVERLIERAGKASSRDGLKGCVATGSTVAETEQAIREAGSGGRIRTRDRGVTRSTLPTPHAP
jgi:hypothetical protein